jgi:hypothetical protein
VPLEHVPRVKVQPQGAVDVPVQEGFRKKKKKKKMAKGLAKRENKKKEKEKEP